MLERLIEIIGLFIFTLMMLDFRLFLVARISAGILISCIYHYLKRIFYHGSEDKLRKN